MSDFKVPGEHIYEGITFSSTFPKAVLEEIPKFEFRQDDVLIATYPKAGTTWIQQIVWRIKYNVNIKTSKELPVYFRSPFLEHGTRREFLLRAKSPRIIKTHLPYQFFNQSMKTNNFKIIVGLRNVKDLLVSYYHFYRMNADFDNFNHDFEAFFKLFQQKRLVFGDYKTHVLGWWAERESPNIHFVKYEDLKADPRREIIKMASFLEKTLTEAEIESILLESSFKSMQNNPTVNMESLQHMNQSISQFIRKGEVGDWKNYFTMEQLECVEEYSAALSAEGLEFADLI